MQFSTMFSIKCILVVFVLLQLSEVSFGFSLNSGKKLNVKSTEMMFSVFKSPHSRSTELFILPDTEGETLVAKPNAKPEGYMSSDLSTNEDGKQGRVASYILFALVPVLVLVPFFLSRGFDPPVDNSADSTISAPVISNEKI
jgi:hypothetical protein